VSFSIVEYEIWPRVSVAIEAERARRVDNLLFVTTLEVLHREQSFIAALDWVLAEAKPRPLRHEEDE
jgi:hypothetical protein